MKTIEELLAFISVRDRMYDLIEEARVEGTDILFALKETKKRTYKKNLGSVLKGRTVEEVYLASIAQQMIGEGYFSVPLQGGYLVVKPKGEEYQVNEESCSCKDFELKGSGYSCKHMDFIKWHQLYRAKVNQYKTLKGLK